MNKKHTTESAIHYLNRHKEAMFTCKLLDGVLELYLDKKDYIRCRKVSRGIYEDSFIPVNCGWVKEEF